jgi:hypothetical protein
MKKFSDALYTLTVDNCTTYYANEYDRNVASLKANNYTPWATITSGEIPIKCINVILENGTVVSAENID